MDAIKDRYAILRFSKTFKVNANPQLGEIEADPRFRYDPEFLKTRVCPALLNKILQQLPLLLKEGIDYSSTKRDMEEWQRATNHLWEFCQEMGLEYAPGHKIYISDLWDELKRWYLDNEMAWVTCTNSGQEVIQIGDAPRKGDFLIKASNQIFTRFSQLFPKISKGKASGHHPTRKNQKYIVGLKFNPTNSAETLTGQGRLPNLPEDISIPELINMIGVSNLVNSLDLNTMKKISAECEKLGIRGSRPDTARDTGYPTGYPEGSPQGIPTTNCENQSNGENSPATMNSMPNTTEYEENKLASQPNFSFAFTTSVTNEVSEIHNDSTNTNAKTVEKKPEIEWVRLKDGRIGNVL